MLHIGNYLGAIKHWIGLQQDYDCLYSIVDLHAITVPQDPRVLREQIISTAALYLACGVDPEKSVMFVQSDVAAHSELAWVLNSIARISELKLMHQYKDKSKDQAENVSMGLFDYPVLMAADILLYQTTLVPVGEDQKQHLELTRELARRFNGRFGDVFKIPEAFSVETGARVMGLDDPEKKMSKSAASISNYIALNDSPQMIKNKISKAVTDSGKEIVYVADKPALANLLDIYSLMSGLSINEIEVMYEGKGYKEFKEGLIEVVIDHLTPIQERYADWMERPADIRQILAQGAAAADEMARHTMMHVKKAVGLGA